ncbi:hypothetical protein Afil01_54840 [Actinorhabdospora filicis]|uniref:Uncharacterized protein n=1 Tax=Actinorhabdospora filicis TaxID=1785913 RepID=A0A9W6W5R6_9ACTN|nr:hypothetical protein [Actinorhabdospora filicis]GLZ80677.1 hypothetical protein Afil01_54840 [Actinorhabdospora filicis]
MVSTDLAQLTVAALALAVAAVRFLRVRRDAAAGWLTTAIGLSGLALLLGWPPLMDAVAAGPGLVRLRLAQHAAAMATVAAMAVFTAHATGRGGTRVIAAWTAGLAVAFAVLTWSAERAIAVRPADVDPLLLLGPDHADVPGVTVYLAAYTGFLGLCLAYVGEGCLRHRRATTGAARLGLLLIAVGCGLGVAYSLHRIIDVTGPSIGGPGTAFALSIAGILAAVVGALLLAVGRRANSK